MFVKSARFYDAIYGFKDYAAASARLREFVDQLNPSATRLLDVACGIGKHLEHLRQWYDVEGLDLNAELLAIARQRCPGVPLHQADMTNFDLGRQFDVVTCLFSSIGYVKTAERMRQSIATMAAHLAPDGLLVVEPWFTPERIWSGHITANCVDESDLKIAWMYTTEVIDRVSAMDIHYLVGTPEGVDSFTERHEVGLFTHEEYMDAMVAAGLTAEYDAEGLFGRGMYVGSVNSRARPA